RFFRLGHSAVGPDTFFCKDWNDGAWASTFESIEPGAEYCATVQVKTQDALDYMVALNIAWTADNHAPSVEPLDATVDTGGEWRQLRLNATAPDWAQRGTLNLVLKGSGTALWKQPSVRKVSSPLSGGDRHLKCGETDRELLVNPDFSVKRGQVDPLGWSKTVWHGQFQHSLVRLKREKTRALSLSASAPECGYGNPSAVWYDFDTFSMESYAATMDHWAVEIKKCDPSREVMHYLGFNLGLLGQWDDLSLTQRPDIFLANSPHTDVCGLQLCAGKGDYHYATITLDLARKYGKPMVATDLQDFTHGLYVGFNSLNRTSLACVAHGMSGCYYYCWEDPSPDYSWHPTWTKADTSRMVGNMRKALEFTKGARVKTDVAFVHPVQPYCEADPGGQKSDMLDCMGWYKAVQQAGLCADVYTPYELTRSNTPALDNYRLVVLPDCPMLPKEAASRLVAYVERGGFLLLAGRTPLTDEAGRQLDFPTPPPQAKKDPLTGTVRWEYGSGTLVRKSSTEGKPIWDPCAAIGLPATHPLCFF
ncbi:MAG TPA: beta-galactosidase trimerization domain-containing protein, partial [bacterium]|nr:beta-galactosidase trimerization domain-containing protein [bacterium]